MDDTSKDSLLARFSACLDRLAAEPEDMNGKEDAESADLYRLFVELAALRSEVRTESRLVKDALDQFRALFNPLQASQSFMEQELRQARALAREEGDRVLRPLLLDLLEVRDRMAAGLRVETAPPPVESLAPPPVEPRRGWSLWRRRTPHQPPVQPLQPAVQPTSSDNAWRQGLTMTLERLDRLLHDRAVTPMVVVGLPFDPMLARVVGTANDESLPHGHVVNEVRAGFRWRDQVLRLADVVVNKLEQKRDESES